jgi:PKD repeat protein
LGLRCRVRGTVYGVNLRPVGLQFTIIDPTGGIGVFSGGPLGGYTVTEGDSLGIIGTVAQFNGLTQMTVDSIEFISTGNPLRAPMVVTQLGENTESQLVKFECMTLVDPGQWGNGTASGFNADITNGTDTIQLRVDADVNLYSAPAPVGSFDVVGIGGQFDSSNPYSSGYQLLPRYTADIMGIAPISANASFVDNGQGDVDFTDLSVGGTTWVWNFGDGNTSTSQNPNHVYATSGTYTVTLTVSDGCTSDTFTLTVTITIIGVDAAFGEAQISLYPNPNNGSFQVAMGNLAGESVRVIATDATGKVVMARDFDRAPGHASFDLSNRAAGLYFVRIESAKGVFTGRMVVGE